LFAFIFCVQNSLKIFCNGGLVEVIFIQCPEYFTLCCSCFLSFHWEICCDFDGFAIIYYLFFLSTAFNIFSLFSVLVVLMIICHGVVLFWLNLFCVLGTSCICMGITFSRFGKFSVIILLNILWIPFACTYSPSSMPMILRFGLLMNWWVLAYSFCRS
jgi:hypothetical protein